MFSRKSQLSMTSGLELLSYGLVAIVAVWPALMSTGHVVGDGVDLYGSLWFFWWIAECVTSLQNPSHTELMFFPLGKDIFAHTGNNFVDALVAVPFVKALGQPAYQPVFVAFVLFGNALSFRPLAMHVLENRVAAWMASLLWQTSPYLLFELMTGRVTQAFVWFLPLAIYWFLRIGEPRQPGAAMEQGVIRQHRAVLFTGVLTALQAATYWFMGYFMALAFGWIALVSLAKRPDGWGRRVRGWALAAFVCVLAIAPALIGMMTVADGGDVPGISESAGLFADPPRLANNVAQTLHGTWLMERHGQPMFSTWFWGAGLAATALLGRDRVRWLGLVLLAVFFGCGTTVPSPWGGEPMRSLPYLLAYNVLPFFERLWFPYRLAVIGFLAASLGIGTVVKRLAEALGRRGWSRWVWLPVIGIFALHGAEQHRLLAFPLLHRDMRAPDVYQIIRIEGGALIELPMGMARESIAWQTVHEQPTFGGMAENAPLFWPEGYRRRFQNTFTRRLRQAVRNPLEQRQHRERDLERLRAEGFRWVVLDRQLVDADVHRWPWSKTGTATQIEQAPFLAQERVTEAIGAPVMTEGALVVWDLAGGLDVPASLRPTQTSLTERTWPREEIPAYEKNLRDMGRLP